MRVLSVFLVLVGVVSAYKFVLFVPNVANSQIQFNARVAEVLAIGGHDVTMLMVNHMAGFESNVKVPKGVKTYQLDAAVEGITKQSIEKEQSAMLYKNMGLKDMPQMMAMFSRMGKLLQDGCRIILRNKEFLKWLEDEKFDVAYTHIYSTCPLGLIHHAKIPSWVWLNSGPLMDYVSQAVGVPILPSYVPPVLMASHDEMGFVQRTKSFIGHVLMSVMHRRISSDEETAIFRKELNDPSFPHTMDIGAKCPLVIVNSNELYDLPRPTLAKVINIGGLGVGFDSAKPLTGEFKKISETGNGLIVFSFGSVAAAHEMPLAWKNSLLEAFASLPDYQFVMRYEGDDLKDRLPENVHLSKWLPQKDLLLHEKTKAFITHGGYNSLQEAISAGVPLITIALMGDQPKNSQIAKKHGFAVNIEKGTISKETVVEALREILENDSYKQKVTRLSAMVRAQPMKPAERLLKWSEFLAEFKTLDNLVPAGQKLNFYQYHSLDVIGFLFLVVLVVFYIGFLILKAVFRKCCRRRETKTKND
ncbi:UDP-glucuronosyltransferase [Caenorhabditis elegans]|uniref:UDP-glucuronosyltransferase n=1 Tax=Caenorhabditis elegans TaxID=6239 RepID=O16276_CAEEL|nr:UDP-glucuronosyltransferase [Caenorhabditis elegans]CCD65240.1 UDP-glucuronosyltransferase [Caenorhabditis elegans]|eukprot:NP_504274.2 UDP-glucuronosyltransferase [Caenorhabditis elegans]